MCDPKAYTVGMEPVPVVTPRNRMVIQREKAHNTEVACLQGRVRGGCTWLESDWGTRSSQYA